MLFIVAMLSAVAIFSTADVDNDLRVTYLLNDPHTNSNSTHDSRTI